MIGTTNSNKSVKVTSLASFRNNVENSGRIRAALMEINFIGNCIRSRESSNAAADEWQYVAMVVGK